MSFFGEILRVGINVVNIVPTVVDKVLPEDMKLEDGRLLSKPLKEIDKFVKDVDDQN